jgi:hypothetical protein
MMRLTLVQPSFVDFMPDHFESGIIYISRRYSTATHLCCCGCGLKVVTPLKPAKWHLAENGGAVSLNPSIGNWSFPCKSHYWIKGNNVQWAGAMSAAAIAKVRAADRRDAKRLTRPRGVLPNIRRWLGTTWYKVQDLVSGWWRG